MGGKKVDAPIFYEIGEGVPLITKQDIDGLDYSHVFRVADTKIILKKLLVECKPINIFGEKGVGKKRLLQDIKDMQIPHCQVVVSKVWKKYDITAGGIAKALGVIYNPIHTISEILEEAYKISKKRILLLFEEIDNLFDDIGKDFEGYEYFFSHLNDIRNSQFFCAVCLSTLPRGAEAQGVESPLVWERVELEVPTRTLLKAEIKRQKPELSSKLVFEVVTTCSTSHEVYSILEHLLSKTFQSVRELDEIAREYNKRNR